MVTRIEESFQLPNGTWLKNRIVKAAMEEKMADIVHHNQPSPELVKLYEAWGKSGAGLILSGHVMIDSHAMAAPADVLLAEEIGDLDEARWHSWIQGAKNENAQFYLQINHPGRQIMKGSGLPVYAPSAVPMKMGAASAMFALPIPLTDNQIQTIIQRFAWTASRAEQLGADGVEIHAAHGYLISQFLSPITNQRTDRWGGSLENRARLLFEVVNTVRKSVSPGFGVGVKINTADFQRGGFEVDDLYWVVGKLNDLQLDFVEVSGGSYESPAMSTGGDEYSKKSSTAMREAYFLKAAKRIQEIATMPIMVTGGITHKQTLEDVLASNDRFLAGIGSALGLMPDLLHRWSQGEDPAPRVGDAWFLPKQIASLSKILGVQYNLWRIGAGKVTWPSVWPTVALVTCFIKEIPHMRAYTEWLAQDQNLAKEL